MGSLNQQSSLLTVRPLYLLLVLMGKGFNHIITGVQNFQVVEVWVVLKGFSSYMKFGWQTELGQCSIRVSSIINIGLCPLSLCRCLSVWSVSPLVHLSVLLSWRSTLSYALCYQLTLHFFSCNSNKVLNQLHIVVCFCLI